MAYQSLLGYAKDGLAEVVASSKSTMSDINYWALDAYRNLKFYSPTTGDLNTWLQSNAVKMPLEGTWVFNSTLTNNSSTNRGGVFTFTSNGTTYNGITLTGTGSSLTVKYNAATVYSSGAWDNEAYRTITFTQPVKYEGNEEFVRWFVDNATPPLNN